MSAKCAQISNKHLLHKYSETGKHLNIRTDTQSRLNKLNVCLIELLLCVILFGCEVFTVNLWPQWLCHPSKWLKCLHCHRLQLEENSVVIINEHSFLKKWVYQFNVMFWLRWCESEDHMQMIMREMYKHWSWAQSTNYTHTNHKHTIHSLYQCLCSP